MHRLIIHGRDLVRTDSYITVLMGQQSIVPTISLPRLQFENDFVDYCNKVRDLELVIDCRSDYVTGTCNTVFALRYIHWNKNAGYFICVNILLFIFSIFVICILS